MESERTKLESALERRRALNVREAVARGDADAAITDAETSALVERARAGDEHAVERLIDMLLPLVGSYARRFPTEGLEHTDLLQEGVVGLLRAVKRFDPARGVPFPAYATWWIRRSLQDARSDFIRPFRLPPKALQQLSRLKTEHQRIYQAEHRSANLSELAQRTNIDPDQAAALASADARVRSLDETIDGSEGELGALGDLLADPLSAAAYEEVIENLAGQQLSSLLSRLTDRERDVIRARFGFEGEAQKLVDVAQRLGVSAERVRQIEERGLAKLRRGG